MEIISGLIAADERVPKKVREMADNLKKTYKAGSIASLHKTCNLAYWLYLYDEKEYCEEILSEFYHADPGSGEQNTYLFPIFILYARMEREAGEEAAATKYTIKVKDSYTPKSLKRILNGSMLLNADIKYYLERNEEEKAKSTMFSQFMRLCLIRELGGSETYPVDVVEAEMMKIKDTLTNDGSRVTPEELKAIKQKQLRPGATPEAIEQLEKQINSTLPEDFKTFYLRHDGQQEYDTFGVIGDEELLSINRIKGEWEIWKSLHDDGIFQGETSSPEKGIKNDWYNPKWIPITSDGGGNNLCIDLDPTQEGTPGQIIRLWHDDPQRTLEATTFTELLKNNNLLD